MWECDSKRARQSLKKKKKKSELALEWILGQRPW